MSDDPRLCRTAGMMPDHWFRFPGSVESEQAKSLCRSCPVMLACRSHARTEGIPHGVFGGEDEAERNLWWKANGGKPSKFLDVIDSLIGERVRAEVA